MKKKPQTIRNNSQQLERRFMPAKELRVQRADNGPTVLEGYAALYLTRSEDFGNWREQLAPGAFTATLQTSPDVRCLLNHDPNFVMGRTRSGTLRLSEDSTGLHFECDLPDTQVARDLATSIERGDIDQCSFGMYVDDDDWQENPDGTYLRTVKAASLFDVSAVTYPAYTATTVSVRSLFPDGIPSRITRAMSSIECGCDCPECLDGECEDCSNSECNDPECRCAERRSANTDTESALLRARIAESV